MEQEPQERIGKEPETPGRATPTAIAQIARILRRRRRRLQEQKRERAERG